MNLFDKYKDLNKFELIQAFYDSCSKNKIEQVKHLVENTKYKIDISSEEDFGLRSACTYGSLAVIKYLLTFSENTPNIHAKNDSAFKVLTRMNKIEVIHFLIFDLNIQKTESISKFLKSNTNKTIDSMFEARELNKQLELDFSSPKSHLKI